MVFEKIAFESVNISYRLVCQQTIEEQEKTEDDFIYHNAVKVSISTIKNITYDLSKYKKIRSISEDSIISFIVFMDNTDFSAIIDYLLTFIIM